MRCLSMLMIGVLGLTNTAYAQVSKPAAYLLVEGLDPRAQSCGVSRQEIQGAVNAALRYNRIRIGNADPDNLIFYVNVNVRNSGSTCAANLQVELYKPQTVTVTGVGEIFARVQFCHKGAVGTFSASNSTVIQMLKDLTDSCLAETSPKVLNAIS